MQACPDAILRAVRRPLSARPLTWRLAVLAVAVAPLAGVARDGAGQVAAPPGPPPATQPPAAAVETVPAATLPGETGPLVSLQDVVRRLGGTLTPQPRGSFQLEVGGERILFGPDNRTVARGTELVELPEPPRVADGTVYVPIAFLDATYGELTDAVLRWNGAERRLELERRRARRLAVSTDVVHLQGITTVVFELPEEPRYRIDERPGAVVVEVTGDTLEGESVPRVDEPLVESIEIGGRRIVLRLAPGAGADSYTLASPFRLVFDVHPAAATGPGEAVPELEAPPPREGVRTIVLDPGHGGSETGAIGPSGVAEKELTLRLARSLKERLETGLGVRVVLTRDEDASLPLETRTAIANQNKADLFVSLHLNSALGAAARGAETYFLSATPSDERAARSAAAENRPAEEGGAGAGDDPLHELQLMLWDLAQSHFLSQSQRLATLIQGELNSALALRDRGVKQAPFVVLMGAAMPAVLVELGFLSNPEEEERLQDPAYRSELTAALARAIGRYKREVEGTPEPAEGAEETEAARAGEEEPAGGTDGAGRRARGGARR